MSDDIEPARRWPAGMSEEERHLEVMKEWTRRIVLEVAQALSDEIVEEVGRIFLKAKEGNFRMLETMDQRLKVLEAALKARKR